MLEGTIIQQNPPEHGCLRPIVGQAFSAAKVKALRPTIATAATVLLDALTDTPAFDARSRFAVPLATSTIAEILGIEPAMYPQLSAWAQELESWFDPIASPPMLARMHEAERNLLNYFRARCQTARPDAPAADLVDRLIEADAALGLGVDSIAGNCVLLIAAAITTTSDLITNGLHLLLTHPEQLARLKQNPELMTAAVEEVLRLEPPVAQYSRIAVQDIDLDGTRVPGGTSMSVSVIAAGCDPAVHEAPHAFDIGRALHSHLAFSAGLHACPGSSLARMETAVAWRAILARFPDLRLAEPPQRRASLVFNGLQQLNLCQA